MGGWDGITGICKSKSGKGLRVEDLYMQLDFLKAETISHHSCAGPRA